MSEEDIDDFYRKRTEQMFMDFIGDCVEEELVTGNPSYKQLREFIEKWVEDHFPFNFEMKQNTIYS